MISRRWSAVRRPAWTTTAQVSERASSPRSASRTPRLEVGRAAWSQQMVASGRSTASAPNCPSSVLPPDDSRWPTTPTSGACAKRLPLTHPSRVAVYSSVSPARRPKKPRAVRATGTTIARPPQSIWVGTTVAASRSTLILRPQSQVSTAIPLPKPTKARTSTVASGRCWGAPSARAASGTARAPTSASTSAGRKRIAGIWLAIATGLCSLDATASSGPDPRSQPRGPRPERGRRLRQRRTFVAAVRDSPDRRPTPPSLTATCRRRCPGSRRRVRSRAPPAAANAHPHATER